MSKKDLVEILESSLEPSEREEIVTLLERAWDLKVEIGEEPDEKKGTDGTGMLGQLGQLKQQLSMMQQVHGLDGLRHNKLCFVLSERAGRDSFDTEKFFQELLSHGVKAEVIHAAAKVATKMGRPYYVKELKMLK